MKNEYTITKEELLSYAKEFHLFGAASVILFVFWLFVGIMGAILLALLIAFGGDWINWYLAILFTLLSIYKLCFSRFVIWRRRYQLLSKTYGVTQWIRSVEFTEEDIVLTDHTSISKFRYENIKRIKEKDNVVMIIFNNHLALRLYKNTFVEGSWEECKELLQSKSKSN